MDGHAKRRLSGDGRHVRRIFAPWNLIDHRVLQQSVDRDVHDLCEPRFVRRQVPPGQIAPMLGGAALGFCDVHAETRFGRLFLQDEEPPRMSGGLVVGPADLRFGQRKAEHGDVR